MVILTSCNAVVNIDADKYLEQVGYSGSLLHNILTAHSVAQNQQ